MKIKWNVAVRMMFFLLLSQIVLCDIGRRLVGEKNVRDMTRKFTRFGSLERIRLRSYKTDELRKFPLISDSTMYLNEAGTTIKSTPPNLNPFNLNRINPTQGRIFDLRLGTRLIDQRQRELLSKSRNVITKADISDIDITGKSPQKVTYRRRIFNRNDRRFGNEIQNRFSPQKQGNRLREKLHSRRSIISPKYNTKRRMTIMRTRNKDYKNLPSIISDEESETRKPVIGLKKEHALTVFSRASNRKNAIQQRSDKRETIVMKRRDSIRNARISKLFDSLSEQEFLVRQPKVRRERNSLVSRRELKIPDGERIRSESARQIQRNVRSRVVRDTNIEDTTVNRRNGRVFRVRLGKRNTAETTQSRRNGRGFRGSLEKRNVGETTENRRNGRGFRGRLEKRNVVDEQRVISLRVRVNGINQRIELSSQRTIFMRDTERSFMYRITKESKHHHFSYTRKQNSLSDLKNNRISRHTNDFEKSTRKSYEDHVTREAPKIGNRERFRISSRAHRFTMKLENSRMERITLNKERPNPHYTERFTLVDNANKENVRLSRTREQNRAVQKRTSQRITSARDTNRKEQSVKNFDNTVNSPSSSRFSTRVGDERVSKTSRMNRNTVVRNNRLDDRMRSVARRFQYKSVMRRMVTRFLEQIIQENTFDRNSRNSDSRNHKNEVNSRQLNAGEMVFDRRVAMRKRRETVDEHRDILRKDARIIQRRSSIKNHMNMNGVINSMQNVDTESIATKRIRNDFRNNDVRLKNRRLFPRNFRIVVSSNSKTNGFVQNNNTSDELYIRKDLKTKDFSNKMSSDRNSVRLYASQRKEQHAFTNLPILKPYNQDRLTLYDYVTRKQSSIISFVFNIILGLAVIVTMSEDINKGFISQQKNQFQHSIFKYLKAG